MKKILLQAKKTVVNNVLITTTIIISIIIRGKRERGLKTTIGENRSHSQSNFPKCHKAADPNNISILKLQLIIVLVIFKIILVIVHKRKVLSEKNSQYQYQSKSGMNTSPCPAKMVKTVGQRQGKIKVTISDLSHSGKPLPTNMTTLNNYYDHNNDHNYEC